MIGTVLFRRLAWILGPAIILFGVLMLSQAAAAQGMPPASSWTFAQVAAQGFGDRQNSYSWSMVWWRGKLYVGTGRATQCVMQATSTLYYPPFLVPYPPFDDDTECTPSPQDLPLQAEIWRWTPETNIWERIYQSPQDLPIPGFPGKYVARDIGFRSMLVFHDSDGTEALYVGGVASNSFNPDVPPARILRSTDGITFKPLPQTPGTFLGDTTAVSFRSMVAYQGKLFVIASSGYGGYGPIYVSENPAGGDNNFKLAFPEALTAFEMSVYRDYLYVGTGTNVLAWPPDLDAPPFTVLKTDAAGNPPYTTTLVLPEGGYRPTMASRSVVSMQVFQDRLYVGTDRPAELYRINPDDTWSLLVGSARWTPIGIMYPEAGMDAGFDNPNNIHIWRMGVHYGRLYVGTMDQSTKWRNIPILGKQLEPEMGYDLYASDNGHDYAMITRTGFGDMFDVGVRTLTSTPYGLFLGSANHYYGTKPRLMKRYRLFIPFLAMGSKQYHWPTASAEPTGREEPSPVSPESSLMSQTLVIEARDGHAVLSWQPAPRAARYHIWRSDFVSNRQLRYGELDPEAWISGPYHEIGTTGGDFFVDGSVAPDQIYHYYVVAEDRTGFLSGPSNLARFPSLAPPVTFDSLSVMLASWDAHSPSAVNGVTPTVTELLGRARDLLARGDLAAATDHLAQLQRQVNSEAPPLEPWRAEDLGIALGRLARRIELSRQGILSPEDLFPALPHE